jgi:CRP-like cAMP-binding protein
MATTDPENPLDACLLLAGIAPAALRLACPTASVQSWAHGSTLYTQGERCSDVCCVLSGQVRLARVSRSGDVFTTGLRTAGDLFGATLVEGAAEPAFETATAKGAVRAWCAPVTAFRTLMQQQPLLALRVVDALARRQREMERRLACFAFKGTEARLVETLRELSGGFEDRCEHGHGRHIRLTQQELADLAGASRPVISTLLNRLRAQGVLGYNREYICVRDIDAVERLVGAD